MIVPTTPHNFTCLVRGTPFERSRNAINWQSARCSCGALALTPLSWPVARPVSPGVPLPRAKKLRLLGCSSARAFHFIISSLIAHTSVSRVLSPAQPQLLVEVWAAAPT